MDIVKELFSLQDIKYKEFNQKLIPTVNPDLVIGVRTPELRLFAKQIKNHDEVKTFLNELPHKYYEENNLHALLICDKKDFGECINELNRFLPYVDNWATCDLMRPECFKRNTGDLYKEIEKWLTSQDVYTVRFGIEMLMTFYLDDEFKPEILKKVAKIRSEEYYINMMIAWFFATALAKRWTEAIVYLEKEALSVWVHNKTIQKGIESFRITKTQKEYLKTLKIRRDKNA